MVEAPSNPERRPGPNRDRRAAFFLLASIAGFILAPVADPEHRWVALAVGVVYAVLAVASFLDSRSRARALPRYRERDP